MPRIAAPARLRPARASPRRPPESRLASPPSHSSLDIRKPPPTPSLVSSASRVGFGRSAAAGREPGPSAAAFLLRGNRQPPCCFDARAIVRPIREFAAASFPERHRHIGSAVGRRPAADLTDPRTRSAPRWAARPAGKARPASRGGHGRVGLGTAAALARAAAPATRRAAAVRHQRSDTRPPLVERRWGRVPMQSAARGRARGASEFRPDREPRAREWRCSFPARSDSGRRGAGPQVLLP